MTLHKKCRNCGEFFPSELLSIEIYCKKCRNEEYVKGKTRQWPYITRIKHARYINLNKFNIYDLKRPLEGGGYERVCRICGDPLKKKDGSYSAHRAYCGKGACNANKLYYMFDWGTCSKSYLYKVKKEQKEKILEELEKKGINKDNLSIFVLCEKCGALCTAGNYICFSKLKTINVHHKIPVHTLTEENIMLIWNEDNFICLCTECHGNAHRKVKINPPVVKNRKIVEWLDG